MNCVDGPWTGATAVRPMRMTDGEVLTEDYMVRYQWRAGGIVASQMYSRVEW